jgi:hypothetical protein
MGEICNSLTPRDESMKCEYGYGYEETNAQENVLGCERSFVALLGYRIFCVRFAAESEASLLSTESRILIIQT